MAIVGGLQGVGLFWFVQAANADGNGSPTLFVVTAIPGDEALVFSFSEIEAVIGNE